MLMMSVPANALQASAEKNTPAAESTKAAICNTVEFAVNSRRAPSFTLSGSRGLSLLGTLLGDVGGHIANVPDGYGIFDVQFTQYYLDQKANVQVHDIVIQRQCLPKEAALSERDIAIMDTVCFGNIDIVGDINTPLDEDEVEDVMQAFRDDNIVPALGAVGWRVHLIPKA